MLKDPREEMLETARKFETLFKECGYNPEAIGIKLLKRYGYNVQTFNYSDSVYLRDKKNETIIFSK